MDIEIHYSPCLVDFPPLFLPLKHKGKGKGAYFLQSSIMWCMLWRLHNYPLVSELTLVRSHLPGENPVLAAFEAHSTVHPSTYIFPRSTRYPSLLGDQRHCEVRRLPDTFTHSQQLGSNPRPSDQESDALQLSYALPQPATVEEKKSVLYLTNGQQQT